MTKELSEKQMLLKKYEEYLADHPGYPNIPVNKKAIIAQLIENYHLAKKQESSAGVKVINESTVTGDVAQYDPVLLPIIRRGAPNLIGMDIFGTQPMTGPTGLLFCLKSVYHNTTATPIKETNSIVLVLASATSFTAGTLITSNGAGAGRGTVRYKEDNIVLVQVTSGTYAVGDNVDDAYPYSSGVTTVSAVYDNEAMYRFLFSDYAKFASVALAEVASTNIQEMGFVVEKTSVTADSYKLKAKYTDELAQDLKALHNLDAESEIVRILSDEIYAEQNRKFIKELNAQAVLGGNFTWNHDSLYYGGDADGRWSAEKAYSFYEFINKKANNIALTTMRGRGNFLVCSLDVASVFETLRFWKSATMADGIGDVNLGTSAFIGTLGGKYRVFVDMYAQSDYVDIGYKGSNEWDAGIYYAPYVPLYVKHGIGEEDGQPRLWFHTRYGLKENPFGAPLYYRHIAVTL